MKYFRKISKKIADFQSKVILTLVYILILPIFVLISRVLNRKSEAKKNSWYLWSIKSDSLDDLKKQY